jgi:hypothetical protein
MKYWLGHDMSTLRHRIGPLVSRAGRNSLNTRRPTSDQSQIIATPAFGPLPPTVVPVLLAADLSSGTRGSSAGSHEPLGDASGHAR